MIEDLEEFQDENGMFIFDHFDVTDYLHEEPPDHKGWEPSEPWSYAYDIDQLEWNELKKTIPYERDGEQYTLDLNAVSKLVSIKLSELFNSFFELVRYKVPEVPVPRFPKNMRLGDSHELLIVDQWNVLSTKKGCVIRWKGPDGSTQNVSLHEGEPSWIICSQLDFQPGRIERFIRDVDRLTSWIQRRIQGLERHIQEIVKQQGKYIDQLEARVALERLRGTIEDDYDPTNDEDEE